MSKESPEHDTLKPGETVRYQLRKIKIEEEEIEQLFNDQESEDATFDFRLSRQPNPKKQGSIGENPKGFKSEVMPFGGDFMKIQKFTGAYQTSFVIQSPFKLNFAWMVEKESVGSEDEASHPVRSIQKEIECLIYSPLQLHLVKIPIEVTVSGNIHSVDEQGRKKEAVVKLERPIQLTYTIKNLCEDHIFQCVSLFDDQAKNFYLSGEIKSRFDIMPLD